MKHIGQYLTESAAIAKLLDRRAIARVIDQLARARRNKARVFILGVGGSAAAASHFVNDLRKLAGIDACAPTDNVSELTARINDDGWEQCFAGWLQASQLRKNDVVFIFSVGGGNLERNISANIVKAIQSARKQHAVILGIVGRDGGYTAKTADACVIVPIVNSARVTPHTEAFHALIAHLIVSHPKLQKAPAKWEASVGQQAGKTGRKK